MLLHKLEQFAAAAAVPPAAAMAPPAAALADVAWLFVSEALHRAHAHKMLRPAPPDDKFA